MNSRTSFYARAGITLAGGALAVSAVLAVAAGDVMRVVLAVAGVLLAVTAFLWLRATDRALETIVELEAKLEDQESRGGGPLQGRGLIVGLCVGGPLDGAELPILTAPIAEVGTGPRKMTLVGPGGVRYEATGVDHTAYRLEAKP